MAAATIDGRSRRAHSRRRSGERPPLPVRVNFVFDAGTREMLATCDEAEAWRYALAGAASTADAPRRHLVVIAVEELRRVIHGGATVISGICGEQEGGTR